MSVTVAHEIRRAHLKGGTYEKSILIRSKEVWTIKTGDKS